MNEDVPLCPECDEGMVKHLDQTVMCSMPPQQGFTWVCYACKTKGERGSYRMGTWHEPTNISEFKGA